MPRWRTITRAALPTAFGPQVRTLCAYHLGQVHAFQSSKPLRRTQRGLAIEPLATPRRIHTAVLRPFLAQQPRETPGIDTSDGDHVMVAQEGREVRGGAPVADLRRQIADNETGRVGLRRFHVFGVNAGVPDMRIG